MKARIVLIFGMVLTLFGAVLGYRQGLVYAKGPETVVKTSYVSVPASKVPIGDISGKPNRIVIPSVGIDVAVVDGFYNSQAQTWNLSETQAQYATITPLANTEAGNTFIYGHNRPAVFKRLLSTRVGATATVYTSNGHVFTYKLVSSRVTKPTDDSLFYYKGNPILTVQTCSGAWFQNRSLYTFELVGAN